MSRTKLFQNLLSMNDAIRLCLQTKILILGYHDLDYSNEFQDTLDLIENGNLKEDVEFFKRGFIIVADPFRDWSVLIGVHCKRLGIKLGRDDALEWISKFLVAYSDVRGIKTPSFYNKTPIRLFK